MDERELFEVAVRRFVPPERSFARLVEQRDRRIRNRRIRAAVVGVIVAILAIGPLIRSARFETVPADRITPDNVERLEESWRADVLPGSRSPMVSGGLVFAYEGSSRRLVAFDEHCAVGVATCNPAWELELPIEGGFEDLVSSPVAADGRVYVPWSTCTPHPDGGASCFDHVYAFASPCSQPCQPLWSAQTGVLDEGSIIVADGLVLIGGNRVDAFPVDCALDGSECEPIWSYEQADGLPVVAGDRLLVADDRSGLGVFSLGCIRSGGDDCAIGGAGTGGGSAPVAVNDDIAVVRNGENDRIRVLDLACIAESCEPQWSAPAPPDGRFGAASIGDAVVVITADVYAPPAHVVLLAYPTTCTGVCRPIWTVERPGDPDRGPYFLPTIAGGYVLTGVGGVTAFRQDCRTDGGLCRPAWTAPASGPPVVADEVVFARDGEDLVAFPLDCTAEGGTCESIWRVRVGAGASDPVVVGAQVYVSTQDGLVAFALDGGAR
jgi:outer membrane protein assembly factor BamB